MSLNEVVSAERIHIGFFGMRNAGKSSLVNAITGQQLAVVSDVKGTTTDPVRKAMELLPLGPVVIIDTPGLDDEGILGELRIKKARQVLSKTDIAVLVVDAAVGMKEEDKKLETELQKRNIPYVVAFNKSDLIEEFLPSDARHLCVSAASGAGVYELKQVLAGFAKGIKKDKVIVSDLFSAGDIVILVTPIDESAPKGRLILPQQMVLRDVLDHHARAIVCQPDELQGTLDALAVNPRLVITDSQVFKKVSADTPTDIPLTSFSILMARYKGNLDQLIDGAEALGKIKDGDKILISEGCTHHRQCNDIGTVKMPAWVRKFTSCEPDFSFTSGGDFPEELSGYKLVIHCGGCMLNDKEMQHRMNLCAEAGIPIVNYGIAIAEMHGTFQRSIEIFN